MNKGSTDNLIRVTFVALVITWLCGCVMPGHRQQIVEEDIQLRIKSPSLQQKKEIRFNKALTAIAGLPADICIELTVKEDKLNELVIRIIRNKVSYGYRVDGEGNLFDEHAQQWFAKYMQMIAEAILADY